MRSLMERSSGMSCSMTTMAQPVRSRTSRSRPVERLGLALGDAAGRLVEQQHAWAPGPAVQARSTMRRVPVDSSPVGRCRRLPRPISSSSSSTRSATCAARTRTTPAAGGRRPARCALDTWRSRATAIVSATVSDGKSRASWNERPSPRWARAERRDVGDVDPAEVDPPRVDRGEAGEAVEQRGLAGAVVADEPEDLAALQLEVDLVDGGDAAEALHQVVGRRAPATRPVRRHRRRAAGGVGRRPTRPGAGRRGPLRRGARR